jgi:DNA-directed RNA polymerase subunit M/transcription elongation factor TFIIS
MATFQMACPHCGAAMEVDGSNVGRKGKCYKCGGHFTVPEPKAKTFQVACPHCKVPLDAEEAWIGQTAQCPSCAKDIAIQKPGMRVAKPEPSAAGQSPARNVPSKAAGKGTLANLEALMRSRARQQHAPQSPAAAAPKFGERSVPSAAVGDSAASTHPVGSPSPATTTPGATKGDPRTGDGKVLGRRIRLLLVVVVGTVGLVGLIMGVSAATSEDGAAAGSLVGLFVALGVGALFWMFYRFLQKNYQLLGHVLFVLAALNLAPAVMLYTNGAVVTHQILGVALGMVSAILFVSAFLIPGVYGILAEIRKGVPVSTEEAPKGQG